MRKRIGDRGRRWRWGCACCLASSSLTHAWFETSKFTSDLFFLLLPYLNDEDPVESQPMFAPSVLEIEHVMELGTTFFLQMNAHSLESDKQPVYAHIPDFHSFR